MSVHKNPYNNCCQVSFPLLEYTKIDVGWGPLGELTALPRPLAGFKGAASRQEANGWEERTRERGEGKGVERGNREGREKRKLGGNSPLVVGGDRRP